MRAGQLVRVLGLVMVLAVAAPSTAAVAAPSGKPSSQYTVKGSVTDALTGKGTLTFLTLQDTSIGTFKSTGSGKYSTNLPAPGKYTITAESFPSTISGDNFTAELIRKFTFSVSQPTTTLNFVMPDAALSNFNQSGTACSIHVQSKGWETSVPVYPWVLKTLM
jgi:hypothetical protein